MNPVPVLKTEGISKRYGELLVTDGVSLDVYPNELHAIIGPNGAGKTTLINQLSGEVFPDSGVIAFTGTDVSDMSIHRRSAMGLARSYQISSTFEEFSAIENIALAALGAGGEKAGFFSRMLADRALIATAEEALAAVGLEHKRNVLAADLAYGERRQLELGMVVAAKPKCLLLDEPMAGMSIEESHKVVDLLGEIKKTIPILLIEHDMPAVFRLADRITVLVYGRVIASGSPDEIKGNPEVKAVYLGHAH